jgi:hypothetical protein
MFELGWGCCQQMQVLLMLLSTTATSQLCTTWLAVVVVLYVHDLKRRRCWVFVDVKYHAARVCTDCDD